MTQLLRQSRQEGHKIVLLNCPEMKNMAQEILKRNTEFFKKGDISWERFNDGFPNIFINDIGSIRGRDVVILLDLYDPNNLLEQMSVLYSLPRYLAKSLIMVLPYFPTGTMERVDQEGQIATAMTLARILSAVPLTQTGPAKLLIYDIHTLQNRFYFGDNVIPLLVTAVPLLLKRLEEKFSEEERKNIAIAYPDEGASKRFGKDLHYYQIICTKVRDGNKRIVSIKEGDPTGKHVIIIDDLVQTGGTLIECKNALLKANAKEVSAYVTHAIFPKQSWKNFTEVKPPEKPFSYFFTTNSCPSMAATLEGKKPFEIIHLDESIANNVLNY